MTMTTATYKVTQLGMRCSVCEGKIKRPGVYAESAEGATMHVGCVPVTPAVTVASSTPMFAAAPATAPGLDRLFAVGRQCDAEYDAE
jgi:hypothetical protein